MVGEESTHKKSVTCVGWMHAWNNKVFGGSGAFQVRNMPDETRRFGDRMVVAMYPVPVRTTYKAQTTNDKRQTTTTTTTAYLDQINWCILDGPPNP